VSAASHRHDRREPRWLTILLILLTLALGTGGGYAFNLLHLPVAWMIGAMCTVMVATLAGLPMRSSQIIRQPMAAVLGVLVGSAFTPAIVDRIPGWWPTLTALVAYVLITSGILFFYFRRLLGLDRVTAFCSATPGGLNQMTILSMELGGDERVVALSQGARILLVVLIIPFSFVALGLYDPATRPPLGATLIGYPPGELAILAACGVVGYGGAWLARIPAASVTGPMVVSATVHLFGWSGTGPPGELIAAAQVVIGAAVGARFAGVPLRRILKIVTNAVGATLIMIVITVVFAVGLYEVVDVPLSALILAFSPGGLAEMSLIALALGMEVAFVATHHFIRISLIMMIGPVFFRHGRAGAASAAEGETAPGE
jgi:membrane AbrB-like protein